MASSQHLRVVDTFHRLPNLLKHNMPSFRTSGSAQLLTVPFSTMGMTSSGGEVIHILGGGALGCFYAHHLHQAGHTVSLLVRNPLAATSAKIRVDFANEEQTEHSEVLLESSGREGPPIQRLLCTVKAFDVKSAMQTLKHRLHPETGVILLHNGLLTESVSTLVPTVDPINVMDAATLHAVYQPKRPPNAHIVLGGPGIMWIGPFTTPDGNPESNGKQSGNLTTLLDAMQESLPSQVQVLDAKGFYRASRRKLGISGASESQEGETGAGFILHLTAPYNAITSLMNVSNGECAAPQAYKDAARLITKEVADVYEAERVALNLGEPDPTLSAEALFEANVAAVNKAGMSYSSTLQDIRNGKQTEIDYINGSICELGKRFGVPTPCNQVVQHLANLRSALGNESFKF